MKLKITLLCLGIFYGGFIYQAVAQVATISGTVKNKVSGESLIGAVITVEGSNTTSVSDGNGSFSIVAQKGATLLISYVGMESLRYKVKNAAPIQILMDEATKGLDEVVVVGYGTQKITKVSGAISGVKAEAIGKLKPVRIEDAIQGTAGVNVIQSGSPGATPLILIRGIPSYKNNGPLIVVDGVPQDQADLNSINPADIESVNVLKDAATAAIYGVRGGNGVIIITTKAGRKNQKTEFNLISTYGIQEVANKVPVLNASEYAAMVNEGSTTSGGDIVFPDLSLLGKGTNWQDEIFEKAPTQSHNITAKGGSDKIIYFLSGAYLSQAGIVGGIDKSKFDRINFTSNITFDLTSKLKFILNGNYVNLSSRGIQENSFNSIIGSALNFDPTVSVFNNAPNTTGKYGFSNQLLSEVFNPLTKLENTYNKNIGNKIYGKFELQYDLFKNLKLNSRFGYTKYDGNAKTFNPLVFYGLNNVDNSMNADGTPVAGKHNSVSQEKASYNQFTYELFGNYNFKISNHNFETTAGFSLFKANGNTAGTSRQDVPFNSWEFADYTSATGTNSATNLNASTGYYYQYEKRNASLFGRINYDYKEKYLASITTRRDGSTSFGKENKWGIFPSGSLGWVISKEDFFKFKFIDFFKIRGSYGSIGTDNVDPQFRTIQTDYLASLYGSGNSIGYTFGNSFSSGSTLASLGNDDIGWEKQLQMNAGFDMNFNNNRFSVAADYYEKKTNGLIYQASAPGFILGGLQAPFANIGNTKSSGLDITLGYNNKAGNNLKVSTSLTFTTVKNQVTATNEEGTARITGGGYFNGQSQTVSVFEKGKSPYYYYGYKTLGLFQTVGEIAASPAQPGAQPGDIKYADLNSDGVIDSKDQTQIGNPFPKFTLGWNLNFDYKNFDFSAFTYASSGNEVYRALERNGNLTNKFRSILNRWTGPGTTNDARNPRYSFTDANNNSRVSDRYIEDGSFIKIRNLVMGYTFQSASVKRIFKAVRLYGQVKNAFTFTRYTGYDPEISAGLSDVGIDRGAYPQARTYSIGLDIKF